MAKWKYSGEFAMPVLSRCIYYIETKKEVKKMSRPYFKTKVIKAKKQKNKVVKFMGRKYELYMKDGKVSIRRHKHQYKPKGNWVNNENLNKIKFPCFCSYIDSENKKKIGMLNRYVKWYRLYNIEKQSDDNFVDDCTSLKNLIRDYDIHILKGKIIIFDDTDERYDIDIEEEK